MLYLSVCATKKQQQRKLRYTKAERAQNDSESYDEREKKKRGKGELQRKKVKRVYLFGFVCMKGGPNMHKWYKFCKCSCLICELIWKQKTK